MKTIKKLKKLTNDQLKNVKGGYVEPADQMWQKKTYTYKPSSGTAGYSSARLVQLVS